MTDWGYRRFILHYARLCQLAGGVDAFCIGSEFRGLTQIRGAGDSFPFVQELRRLAGDVRAILGPKTKISYAADWSEYFGYVADGNRYHHLDPLWADENIDFVGIDNYMPVSDWRDGDSHMDAGFGSIYNPDYLARNIQGGEGFDWYYASAEGLAAQRREPIRDHLGEDWIWRYKDLKSWWSEPHFERIDGVRQDSSTAWIPMSKPIWFTELGCAAIDKGGNQPNLFLDPKSSEGALPRFSNGQRDDLMQMQYHLTQSDYWARPENNPVSALDGRRMLDPERCFAWAWDARPYPVFPLRETVWGDAANYERGHWLNGRSSAASLRDVVDEILIAAGARHFDTSRLYGLVRGYVDNGSESVRAALQPLMLACGFDCFESEGVLDFVSRQHQDVTVIDTDRVVAQADGDIQRQRSAPSELPRVMRLGHVEADGAYEPRLATVALPGPDGLTTVADAEVTLVLTPGEARNAADRGLVAAQVGRETLRFALPRSMMQIRPGDLLQLGPQIVRVDRIAEGASLELEATCVNTLAGQSQSVPSRAAPADFGPEDTGFLPLLLDLPLLTSEAASHAPYVAIGAEVWPGSIALWDSASENDFRLNCLVAAPSVMGQTETDLNAGPPGLFHAQASLRVALLSGSLASVEMTALLNGDNLAAIGDAEAQRWEIIQFKTATPVAAGVWELSGLLRRQYGTDAVGPAVWPPGSSFVLLGRTREQIRLDPEAAELRRHYRFGLASQGYDAESVVESVTAFAGNGRRPYAVCHLRHERRAEADRFSWIRRTRLGGDSWSGLEVPLGEAAEAYRLRVIAQGRTVREVTLQGPSWDYSLDLRRQDGLGGSYEVEVAQLSDSFGAGPARRIVVG